MKELIVKDEQGFRLRITVKDVLRPANMKNVEFIQESKDREGNVDFTSTYQFFMTPEELESVGKFLSTLDFSEVDSTQGPLTFVTKVFSRTE